MGGELLCSTNALCRQLRTSSSAACLWLPLPPNTAQVNAYCSLPRPRSLTRGAITSDAGKARVELYQTASPTFSLGCV